MYLHVGMVWLVYVPACGHVWLVYVPACGHVWLVYVPACGHVWLVYVPACGHGLASVWRAAQAPYMLHDNVSSPN